MKKIIKMQCKNQSKLVKIISVSTILKTTETLKTTILYQISSELAHLEKYENALIKNQEKSEQ